MGESAVTAVKRVFVKVSGFSDEERHALGAQFRLSESRPTAYSLWLKDEEDAAGVVLVDGDSWEAALELANPANDRLLLVWVGQQAPARASLAVARPLHWGAVMERLDALLASRAKDSAVLPELDLDLDFDAYSRTDPSPLALQQADSEPAAVLVVDADDSARLYLRAKLASAGLLRVDEAGSGAQALQLLDTRCYKLVILDLDLPDTDSWKLIKQVKAARPAVDFLLLTGSHVSWLDGMRGWLAGARACQRKPLHPGKLKQLLGNLR